MAVRNLVSIKVEALKLAWGRGQSRCDFVPPSRVWHLRAVTWSVGRPWPKATEIEMQPPAYPAIPV